VSKSLYSFENRAVFGQNLRLNNKIAMCILYRMLTFFCVLWTVRGQILV